MTRDEAKCILWLYRGEIDSGDPAFAEALREAERDPELAHWLQDHLAAHSAIRARLKDAPFPEGLAERIIGERPAPWWRQPVFQLAASILILAAVVIAWFTSGAKKPTLEEYGRFTARVVTGKYAMGLESADHGAVRRFLAANQALADYKLPQPLEKERLLGCAALSWDGHPVSLLCFRRQQGPGAPDLWLFVTDAGALPKSIDSPRFANTGQVGTAAWGRGGKIYLLAAREDSQFLRPYVEKLD
jgi:hypothetical protein